MDVVIYQSLIIYMFVLFYGVHTFSVVIGGSKVGLIGENGTEIECSYIPGNYIQSSVSIMAFNKSSTIFETIATYVPNQTPVLLTQGQYLNGRVTLTSISKLSPKAILTFNELMCIDGTFYKCQATYIGSNGNDYPISNNTTISVQVPPSKPDSISIVHTPAYSTVSSAEHIDYSTTLPSSKVTSTENETRSAIQTMKQNDTTAFTHSTLPATNHNTSTPLGQDPFTDNSYRSSTHSIQQTTTEKVLAVGDTLTVICTGDVGKPPAKHFFQKYRSDHTLSMTYTATETSISEISENCSYYRTSNLTFKVSADDNKAMIRCVVNSSMVDSDMYVETESIEVYYEVSEPNITKYPNKPYYVVGVDNSVILTCKSDGNPKPHYQWYKKNDSMLISTNESWTITDMNVTNSGIYTCNVNNTFNGDTYRNVKHVPIDIMNKDYTTRIIPEHSSTLADISTTKSSSIGSSSGVDKEEEKPEGNISLVIGIVVAVAVVTIIVVIIVIIACRRRKSKSPTSKNDDSKPKPVTEPRTGDYDYIALEDDAPTKGSNNGLEVEDITKHNAEYLKKQEEEEKKKNESNTPPQPAVYAQVNEATKSKNKPKTESTENTDKQEEDPYAETQEDVYDKAGNSRHKVNENAEHFDSLSSSKQNSNGDNKLSIQTSQVGSYANQGFEKDENRKVATVSPTVRSSSGSQNNEQTNSNRNSQSKKGYENIIGTDQTGISEEETSHRTAL